MANLDMRDIMMERGFWDSVGSGGRLKGLPDGRLPGRLRGPGWPEDWGAVGGPAPPWSMPAIMLGEVMLREGLLFWGIPGLCMGGLGEEVQPGEGAERDGDFRWTGEAPAEPITEGDLMEAIEGAGGPPSIPAN